MDTILTNSKARHEYHIEETFEAGIVLSGTEVKSLRAGKGQIRDAFARVEDNEIWLYNAHIDEYSHGNTANHQPKAKRKLPKPWAMTPGMPAHTIVRDVRDINHACNVFNLCFEFPG